AGLRWRWPCGASRDSRPRPERRGSRRRRTRGSSTHSVARVIPWRSEDNTMPTDNFDSPVARRSFLTRFGAGMTVLGSGLAAGTGVANAQSAGSRPVRHTQDAWMDTLPGKHRLVFDTTTPAGFGAAVAYANNFLTASKDGYGLTDQDHGIII